MRQFIVAVIVASTEVYEPINSLILFTFCQIAQVCIVLMLRPYREALMNIFSIVLEILTLAFSRKSIFNNGYSMVNNF